MKISGERGSFIIAIAFVFLVQGSKWISGENQ